MFCCEPTQLVFLKSSCSGSDLRSYRRTGPRRHVPEQRPVEDGDEGAGEVITKLLLNLFGNLKLRRNSSQLLVSMSLLMLTISNELYAAVFTFAGASDLLTFEL